MIINTPISNAVIDKLKVGDIIWLSGLVLCGRDAVLPKLVKLIESGKIGSLGINLEGQAVFHTAVSPAGVGPTSSNKIEIESSILLLSSVGIKIHLGKGQLHKETIEALDKFNSVYAIIPPVSALLHEKTSDEQVVAFPELGMEALHMIKVDRYPAIIGAAHGRSIYE